jgi:lipopolysaccharide/colanic/teichoic acid biosynthesis glycosyltransferase
MGSKSPIDGIRNKNGQLQIARAPIGSPQPQMADRKAFAIPVNTTVPLTAVQRLAELLYRIFEIVVATLAMIVCLPILILEAIAIRLDSKGHVLFRHDRVGQSKPTYGRDLVGRTDLRPPAGEFQPDQLYWAPTRFRFVKFRTMHHDALERFPELYWWNYQIQDDEFQNYYHNLDEDPRVTRVGRFLRKTSLDELVNFWHVITGECRLVGPRPEIPDILPYYTPDEMRKFTVKPGLTCLWAIRGRGELSVREKNQLDLEYLEMRSIALDLKILFLTIWCVLTRRGAY